MKLQVTFYPVTINVPSHVWNDPVTGREREVNELILEKAIEEAIKRDMKKGVLTGKNTFVESIGLVL
jgi:hypothetical protein